MYGVATFVQGRWRAEVPEWDLEGRVVVVRGTASLSSTSMPSTGLPSRTSMMQVTSLATDTS